MWKWLEDFIVKLKPDPKYSGFYVPTLAQVPPPMPKNVGGIGGGSLGILVEKEFTVNKITPELLTEKYKIALEEISELQNENWEKHENEETRFFKLTRFQAAQIARKALNTLNETK